MYTPPLFFSHSFAQSVGRFLSFIFNFFNIPLTTHMHTHRTSWSLRHYLCLYDCRINMMTLNRYEFSRARDLLCETTLRLDRLSYGIGKSIQTSHNIQNIAVRSLIILHSSRTLNISITDRKSIQWRKMSILKCFLLFDRQFFLVMCYEIRVWTFPFWIKRP